MLTKLTLPLLALALLAVASASVADAAGKVIDLDKPVGASLKPDGFYWSFDDGLIGESEPTTVVDLSGNDFDGQISRQQASMTPIYVDGVFGTGVYVQGYPQVSWRPGDVAAAADNSKLLMEGQPFTGGIWFKMDDRKPGGHVLIRRDDNGLGWQLIVWRDPAEDADAEGTSWSLQLRLGNADEKSYRQAFTSAFADGQWHHVGFSVTPDPDGKNFTVVYWLDGELFDTVSFAANIPDSPLEKQFLAIGNGVWGLLDDAFVTTGVYTFKK